jgi:TrmH family RNA methyltransferase
MTRQRLKDIASLARSKGRRAHGQLLVEGARSVASAVAAGAPLVEVLVARGATGEAAEAAAFAERAGLPVHTVAARDLDRAGDARTGQGVLAVAASVVGDGVDGVEGPTLALDGVQDPGNVGGLVRTAAWFGAAAVVADAASADFETPKAVRAAMGGLWDLRLARVPRLGPALDALAARGYAAWGADLDGTPLADWRPSRRAVLVVGSEAHGLSAEVGRRLAGRVSVAGAAGPTRGVESLNVGVAAGIVMAAWLR